MSNGIRKHVPQHTEEHTTKSNEKKFYVLERSKQIVTTKTKLRHILFKMTQELSVRSSRCKCTNLNANCILTDMGPMMV